MRIDLHVHSNHSCDSKASLDEMCQAAIQKGVDIVCFTEHMDLNPLDGGYCYFQYDKYHDDIERARVNYAGKLTVLKGIEFSEPHMYPRELEKITKADFDFVLGSVHWLRNFGAYWADVNRLSPDYPVQRLYEAYYIEVLEAVRSGGFDSLAHLDFPKRYLPNKHEPDDLLEEIMDEMSKRGIALEINSQPIRKAYPEINPSDSICALYASCGGRNITTGSDAHNPENIGQDFDSLDRVIRLFDFQPVYFRHRKLVPTAFSSRKL